MCDFVEMEHLQNLNKLIRTLKVGGGGLNVILYGKSVEKGVIRINQKC